MTTRTYKARVLEIVSFTKLFNSIIIKKKVSSLPKENVSKSLPKGIKGRIMYVVCFLVLYEWEPGQHFDTDIGAVDVVVVIDDEGTAVVVVEAVEAVEAVEVEKMIWLSAVIVSIDRLSGRQPACKNSDVGSPKVCITKGIEQWIDG